jgi:hypothetical protein
MKMSRRQRVVASFAGAGFVVPWLFLLCYIIADRLHISLSTTPLLYLCPSSIASLGLDSASWFVGLIGWLLIGLSNAAFYSLVGVMVSIFVPRATRRSP